MRQAIRILMIAILVGIIGVILYQGWGKSGSNQFETAFVRGGKVSLDLSAGGYNIVGTPENRIRLRIDSDHDEHDVQCRMSVDGDEAKVQVNGPSNNFHATIYIPQRTDLTVDQTIGDLVIENVEGNKNLGLNIGRMQVQVPTTGVVPSFDGSVMLGSLRASVWHIEKGGFFRGYTMQAGQPSIKAHVDIGDLEVVGVSARSGDSHAQQSEDTHDDMPGQNAEDNSE